MHTVRKDVIADSAVDRFPEVLAEELRAMPRADGTYDEALDASDAYASARARALTALAFSGGGIRSATFNLGLLQALAKRRLLRSFDYLSTVSGGGYIGAWLSAMLHARGDDATIETLEPFISPIDMLSSQGTNKAREFGAIAFLRAYSNYLTPHIGLLSLDTLAAVAAYLRNVILVQSTVITFLVCLLLVPRLFMWVVLEAQGGWDRLHATPLRLLCFATMLFLLSAWSISRNIGALASRAAGSGVLKLEPAGLPGFAWRWIIAPAACGALLTAIAFAQLILAHAVEVPMPAVCFVAGGTLLGAVANAAGAWRRSAQEGDSSMFLPLITCGLIAGALAGVGLSLLYELMQGLRALDDKGAILTWFAVSVAPFLVLWTISLALVAYLGLLGRHLDSQGHEWWARYGGYSLGFSLAAGGLLTAAVWAPVAVHYAQAWAVNLGGMGWLVGSLWGVYKGASASTGAGTRGWTERVLSFAPYLFIGGLVVALSCGIHRVLDLAAVNAPRVRVYVSCEAVHLGHHASEREACVHGPQAAAQPARPPLIDSVRQVIPTMAAHESGSLGLLALVSLTVMLLLAWRVDINLFSFHNFYRNRLTRCYLGAVRKTVDRQPNPTTGFDPADDFPLGDLADEGRPNPRVRRPLHLLNTTLNFSTGASLAWQQRKAGSFFFSALRCGYQLPATADLEGRRGGFAVTRDYMRGERGSAIDHGVMLGSVVATSGAAASPNWGFHTSTPIAFILTLFNVRLGRWCPNPARKYLPRQPAPSFGGMLLLDELFGTTNTASQYVYLSDGGHFDNLGVYELVRRRVSTIVVSDCGQDVGFNCDDLADTVRKCYTDLGVRIEIDVTRLQCGRAPGAERYSESHFTVGKIHYPVLDTDAAETKPQIGKLIVIKPSLSHDIFRAAPDIRNYALTHREFPQQTTSDQWFDEAQFESYRKLGFLIGEAIFSEVVHVSDIEWAANAGGQER